MIAANRARLSWYSVSYGCCVVMAVGVLLAAGCNRSGKETDPEKGAPATPVASEKPADKPTAANQNAADHPESNHKTSDPDSTPPAQRVAIVDATRATNVLGLGIQINNQLQAVRLKHQPTLQNAVSVYADKFKKKQAQFGDKPTDAQKNELQSIIQERDNTLQRLQVQIEQEVAKLQQSLLAQAGKILRPAIKRVADRRGYTLVINGDMAYSAGDDDITEDVILDVRAHAEEIKSLEPPFEKDKADKTPTDTNGK